LYFTASGIITPVGGRPVQSLCLFQRKGTCSYLTANTLPLHYKDEQLMCLEK